MEQQIADLSQAKNMVEHELSALKTAAIATKKKQPASLDKKQRDMTEATPEEVRYNQCCALLLKMFVLEGLFLRLFVISLMQQTQTFASKLCHGWIFGENALIKFFQMNEITANA